MSWIHTSQKGFWECFCQVCADIPCTTNSSKSSKCPQHITKSLWQCIRLVCMCRYPVYNEFLKELQISSSRFYKRSVSKLIYPKRRSALWVECTHRKIFWECFSLVCMWRYPVCNEFLKEIQISLSRFYTSSVSRMLYEKEGWILWVKSTHHKKVSENASV